MVHKDQKKEGTWARMVREALEIKKRVEAGESIEEFDNAEGFMAAFYDLVYQVSPTRKKSKKTTEIWWTFNAKLAEIYLLVTPFMYAKGLTHGVLTFEIPVGDKMEQVKMRLRGPNEDGMLVALEQPNLMNGKHVADVFNMEQALTIMDKYNDDEVEMDGELPDIRKIFKIQDKD